MGLYGHQGRFRLLFDRVYIHPAEANRLQNFSRPSAILLRRTNIVQPVEAFTSLPSPLGEGMKSVLRG